MTTIIYCASWEKGEAKFDELINKINPYSREECWKIVKKKRGSYAQHLSSGSCISVVYAYDGARGHKWHECYIDEDISIRILNNIIIPDGRFFKDNWEEGVTYF